uniref:Glutaredoxin n=1 Tax=Escherichia phage UFV-AREG1 TaxID=1837867 RepID=A0A173GA59_9CAUD
MYKFRKGLADFLTTVTFFLFMAVGAIFLIPFIAIFFVISLISPEKGLSSSEFNERLDKITNKELFLVEQNSNLKNKIEVYGIPDEVGRCPGCQSVTKLLKELNAPFTFYKVLTNNGKIEYDRPLIVSLAKRAGFTSLNIRYPVIFINDSRQKNIKHFKETLISLGYDRDIIED